MLPVQFIFLSFLCSTLANPALTDSLSSWLNFSTSASSPSPTETQSQDSPIRHRNLFPALNNKLSRHIDLLTTKSRLYRAELDSQLQTDNGHFVREERSLCILKSFLADIELSVLVSAASNTEDMKLQADVSKTQVKLLLAINKSYNAWYLMFKEMKLFLSTSKAIENANPQKDIENIVDMLDNFVYLNAKKRFHESYYPLLRMREELNRLMRLVVANMSNSSIPQALYQKWSGAAEKRSSKI